jgi:Tfp pilus assembly protein PilF
METTRDDILNAAQKLSQADRLIIANQILETLESELPGADLESSDLLIRLEQRSGQWKQSLSWEQLQQQLEINE